MKARTTGICCGFLCVAVGLSGCGDWSAPESHEAIVQKDLVEILQLQGLPCPKVDSFTTNGRLDYRIECSGGETYGIRVSPEGIIGAETQP